MEYIGETNEKRVTRYQQYLCALALTPADTFKAGTAVVLAGREAGELGMLRDVLHLNPDQVMFVDHEEIRALRKVEEEWPGVKIFNGDLLKALRSLDTGVSFLNADFMGHLDSHKKRIIHEARSLMIAGSMVFYTFARSHKDNNMDKWSMVSPVRVMSDMQRVPSGKRSKMITDEVRWLGYASELQDILGMRGQNFEPVFMLRYDSKHENYQDNNRHSAMATIGFQYMPERMKTDEWRKILRTSRLEGMSSGWLPNRVVKDKLVEAALELIRAGKSSSEISSALNVPMGTVAAIRANETRGTYKKH